MNLNEEPDEETYKFLEWVEPGSCLRAASGLNTTAIKNVLLDTEWYGPEYDVNCDPRLDPKKLDPNVESDKILLDKYFSTEGGYDGQGEGVFNTRGVGFDVYRDLGTAGSFNTNVDIPEISSYANERNVGIILYVNSVYFPDSSVPAQDKGKMYEYVTIARKSREGEWYVGSLSAVAPPRSRGIKRPQARSSVKM